MSDESADEDAADADSAGEAATDDNAGEAATDDNAREADTTTDSGDDNGENDTEAAPDDESWDVSELDDADLIAEIGTHDETIAALVADRIEQAEELETELDNARERIDDLESALKRTRADFENYKKRAKRRQEEIRSRATEDLVGRLTTVRENLLRALEQDEDADIRPGVESTLAEFDRVLESEGVEFIEPDAGDDVDPARHEVLMRVESDEPTGTIVDVYAPGYEMGGKIIQEAQVTVSDDE